MKLLAPGSLPRLTLLLAATVVALHSASGRSTNQQGLKLIKEFEGFYPNYYIDPVGIKTIGYGHACHANSCGPEIKPPLTEAQATELLITDLQRSYEPCVEKAVTVPLNDNQFSALVSFVFNLGCGAFKSSTLLRRLNAKENPNKVAEEELPKWNKGGGKVLPGLTRRRKAEVALFTTPVVVRSRGLLRALTADRSDQQQHGFEAQGTNQGGAVVGPQDEAQQLVDSLPKTEYEAYENGTMIGKLQTVKLQEKAVAVTTAVAYLRMTKAYGSTIKINSGFRTMAEQEYFYQCYLTKACNNGNLAAKPGFSNHQNGKALDLNVNGVPGVYDWLARHAHDHGFVRTVPSERWHWEYRPGEPRAPYT